MQTTKHWQHPLPEMEHVVVAIRQGNSTLFDTSQQRDLSVKKEILESRPYPVKLHHWTEAEFEAFLDKHRFPPNTYRDRLEWRRSAVRKALASGQYVPAEVLSEQSANGIVEDALLDIRSQEAFGLSLERHNANCHRFSVEMLCLVSDGTYSLNVDRLLVLAAKADSCIFSNGVNDAVGMAKRLLMDGISSPLTVVRKTPNQYNRHHNRMFWLEVRDADFPDQSLYGELMRFSVASVSDRYRQLVADGKVDLAGARSVMGEQWQSTVVVSCIKSAELEMAELGC